MIDDEREVIELIEALNRQLPMRAYATPRLAKAIREQEGDVTVNDPVTIDSVLYLGDDGGIGCALSHSRGKSVVVTSITHLAFDEDHPLTARIRAYQSRRSQHLAGAARSGSRRGQTGAAAKRRRERRARKKSPQADLDRRFREGLRLWRLGKYARSADAFREVLEWDPDDLRFARYYLASSLLQSDSSGELDKLLQRYDDHSGIWRFTQTLQAFRREGDSDESQRLLVEADRLEPGFEDYLLRDKLVDAGRDVRFDAGDDERAFACARLFLPAWRGTPGAASWARRVLNVPPVNADREQFPRRFPQEQLRALPLRRETWQVGLMPCRDETTDEDASPL